MTKRTTQLAARLAIAGSVVAVIGAAAIATLPLDRPAVSDASIAAANSAPSPSRSPSLTMSDFDRILTQPWRGEAAGFSPDHPDTRASAAEAAGLPVTFAGTIGNSLALLRGGDGAISVCAIGESAAGVQVESIEPGKIEVRFGGRLYSLVKPKDGP